MSRRPISFRALLDDAEDEHKPIPQDPIWDRVGKAAAKQFIDSCMFLRPRTWAPLLEIPDSGLFLKD